MKEALSELYRYRELLRMITYRDIQIKYKQSIMGLFWAILMPALVVVAGLLVKYVYATTSGGSLNLDDAATIAVKSIPWAFVVASIRFASTSLIGNAGLVSKIYFPKEILPFAAVGSQLFDLAVASVMLVVILFIARIGASWQLMWVPALLVILIMLTAGVAMIVSAASLFFRDVKYIVEVLLTFGIFFTPVFYDIETLGEKGRFLLVNPVAPILEGFRSVVVLHRGPDLRWLIYSTVVGLCITVYAYLMFKKLEPSFAESI